MVGMRPHQRLYKVPWASDKRINKNNSCLLTVFQPCTWQIISFYSRINFEGGNVANSFFIEKETDWESLSNLPKVTELINGRAKFNPADFRLFSRWLFLPFWNMSINVGYLNMLKMERYCRSSLTLSTNNTHGSLILSQVLFLSNTYSNLFCKENSTMKISFW
jgi:hypothetical protein